MMIRTATIVTTAALLLGFAGWRSGSVRGTVAAVVDNARGLPASYSLGCTDMPPREPRDFRVRELLARDYNMSFITIGGIGPTPFQGAFVEAYDKVSYRLLQLRYGKRFDNEVSRRAAADVYQHEIVLEGCYWSPRELVTSAREIILVDGPPAVMRALSSAEKKRVRLQGTMTDIHGSKWRSWGRPEIHVARVEVVGAACGRK